MWKVADTLDSFWWIENTQTGERIKIGRARWTGVNYYDRAVEETIARNLHDYEEAVTVTADGSKYNTVGTFVGMLELPSE